MEKIILLIKAQPTPAQAEAGNYKKRKFAWRGLTAGLSFATGLVQATFYKRRADCRSSYSDHFTNFLKRHTGSKKTDCLFNIPLRRVQFSPSFIGGRYPSAYKCSPDCSPGNTVFLTKLPKRNSLFVQLDGFIKRPFSWPRHQVLILMMRLGHQFEVIYRIVQAILVFVMNYFTRLELSSKMLLHDKAMLKKLLSYAVCSHGNKPVFRFTAERSHMAARTLPTHGAS